MLSGSFAFLSWCMVLWSLLSEPLVPTCWHPCINGVVGLTHCFSRILLVSCPTAVVLLQVTEMRKHVMPLDGTFDFWVLLCAMSMSLFAAGMGIRTLSKSNALLEWNQGDSLLWIGVVFAIADATPGLLFLGCATRLRCQRHMQIFVATAVLLQFGC